MSGQDSTKKEDAELERIRSRKVEEMKTHMRKEAGRSCPIVLDDAHFDETVQKHPLMLIDCWADWCGPCRMIAPVIEELAMEYVGRLVVAKLNVDDNSETANRFRVMTIPTLLIMKNGVEVDRVIGAVPKQLIEDRLRKHF